MKTDTAPKMVSLEGLLLPVQKLKAEGKTIVTSNGCFDILHVGHTEILEWASRQGDVLIVGLNSDESVRANKGNKRPVVPQGERLRIVASFAAVDYAFIFASKGPINWLKLVRPHVHVKGPDSDKSPAFAPEKAAVEEGGGVVRIAPRVYDRSTTSVINKVLSIYT